MTTVCLFCAAYELAKKSIAIWVFCAFTGNITHRLRERLKKKPSPLKVPKNLINDQGQDIVAC